MTVELEPQAKERPAALRPARPRGRKFRLSWPENRPPAVAAFAGVTFLPVPVLVLAAIFGGLAGWVALIWIALCLILLDEAIARAATDAPEGMEFPAADGLSIALALAHFGLLVLAVAALSGHTLLEGPSGIAVWIAFGMFFGQVSNANAHELIHRTDKRLFQLGKWVYVSLLYGHHTSAHRLVHHRFVATPDDPNSAHLGESFWAFAPRAWKGAFVAGYEMERQRAARLRPPGPGAPLRQRLRARLTRLGPYPSYLLGGLWFVLAFALLFGWEGALAYLSLCLYAQIQILLADYVQHYGLERKRRGDGGYEPVGPRHSWDAPHPLTSLWMLNAPRHSDHHAHPARVYPALRLGDTDQDPRPILPRSLPAMAALALVPPLWRRVMDRRVKALGRAPRVTPRKVGRNLAG